MRRSIFILAFLLCLVSSAFSAPIEIELVQYKPEAFRTFDSLAEKFNATHKNIHLKISSPNEPMTILKTRFIRDNYPDIIGIGGDMDFSNFQDAGLLADVSGYKGLEKIKPAYIDIINGLKFVPTPGVFGVPYPETWSDFIKLCDDIKAAGILPMYFGFKDTWTTLAPWNALAVDLVRADVCQEVNLGNATFAKEYREVAEKIYSMLKYAESGPFAYGYNDACTAFARGESAMYVIGNYAIPQILSVNPTMNIDSFVMPGREDPNAHTLNSGVDIMFCVMEACPNKDAAYEVIDFLLDPENIQSYVNDQNSVPCQIGNFKLTPMLNGMRKYIDAGKMADYHDHHYPSEMAVDAQIQTYLLHGDINAFLAKFDTDWVRYNRDIIEKLKKYNASHK